MKKGKLIIVVFFICAGLSAQKFPILEKALNNKYPDKESFTADGIWVYYREMGEIQKLNLSFISKLLPDYEFYSVYLTYYLDQHIQRENCLVLLNKKDQTIVLNPPSGYQSFDEGVYGLIKGHEFVSEKELQGFIKDAETIALLDSRMHLGKTNYGTDEITINLLLEDREEIWESIGFIFEKDKLVKVYRK